MSADRNLITDRMWFRNPIVWASEPTLVAQDVFRVYF